LELLSPWMAAGGHGVADPSSLSMDLVPPTADLVRGRRAGAARFLRACHSPRQQVCNRGRELGLLGPSSVLSVSCSSVWASRSRARRRCCSVAVLPWLGLPRGQACISASAKLVERAGVACAAAALCGSPPPSTGCCCPPRPLGGGSRGPGLGAAGEGLGHRAPRAARAFLLGPFVMSRSGALPAHRSTAAPAAGDVWSPAGFLAGLPIWLGPGRCVGSASRGMPVIGGLLAGSVLVVSLQNWCPCWWLLPLARRVPRVACSGGRSVSG
jgi:hypothetical protein